MRVDDKPIGDLIKKSEETLKDVEEVVHAIEAGVMDAAVDTIEKELIVKNNLLAGDAVKSLGEYEKIFDALKSEDYGPEIASVTELASIVSQIPSHFEAFKGEKLPHIEKEAEEIKDTGEKLVDNIKEQRKGFAHDIKNIYSFGDFVNIVVI